MRDREFKEMVDNKIRYYNQKAISEEDGFFIVCQHDLRFALLAIIDALLAEKIMLIIAGDDKISREIEDDFEKYTFLYDENNDDLWYQYIDSIKSYLEKSDDRINSCLDAGALIRICAFSDEIDYKHYFYSKDNDYCLIEFEIYGEYGHVLKSVSVNDYFSLQRSRKDNDRLKWYSGKYPDRKIDIHLSKSMIINATYRYNTYKELFDKDKFISLLMMT